MRKIAPYQPDDAKPDVASKLHLITRTGFVKREEVRVRERTLGLNQPPERQMKLKELQELKAHFVAISFPQSVEPDYREKVKIFAIYPGIRAMRNFFVEKGKTGLKAMKDLFKGAKKQSYKWKM
jgi:hypothetical protein